MIIVQRFVCNMLQENCYVLSDDSNECVIVDCGAWYGEERRAIVDYISSHGLTPRHLLSTHGHVDHNFGNNTIYDTYGLKARVHTSDIPYMENLAEQSVQFIGCKPDYEYPPHGAPLADGDEIAFGNHKLSVIHTPGHSSGSVCFYIKDENIMLTGDTLFRLSIGRTDLAGGSMMQIIQSLRMLAQLPDETVILPGHGPSTTMGEELSMNPFLDR